METQSSHNSSHSLRRALMGNGVFSTLSGVGILIFTGQLAKMMGMSETTTLYIVGPGLLLFGISLFVDSRRASINQVSVTATVVMDALWVAGSCLVLAVPLGLSGTGKGLIAVVALIVGIFAIWQWRGLREIKRNQ